MYHVKSRFTKAVALLVGLLLVLYGVLLFGDHNDPDGEGPFAQWVQEVRRDLGISLPASDALGWELVLVNDHYSVPEGFPKELVTLKNGKKVDARIYPDLQAMFDAARRNGLELTVRSGYRTKETQKQVLEDKEAEFITEGFSGRDARKLAREWVARPGHSEHELGLAVDINAEEDGSPKEALYSWLVRNSWKYGFICRYPTEKSEITHVEHEPWHYRYVGKDHARAMYEKNLCLEEYVELLSKG